MAPRLLSLDLCCHFSTRAAVFYLPNHVNLNCHFVSVDLALPKKFWRTKIAFKPCLFGFLCMPPTVYCPLDSPGYREERKREEKRGEERRERRGEAQRQCCCFSVFADEPEVISIFFTKYGKHVCVCTCST